MPGRILLADDHEPTLAGLEALCRAAGHEVWTATSGPAAVALARLHAPDVVLLDLHMPGGDGLEALPDLLALEPPPSVLFMTAEAEVASAVTAMRGGAADYLEKPVRPAVLEAVLGRELEKRSLVRERDRLREEVAQARWGPLQGESPAMQRLFEQVERVASTPRTTVLVTGESGVGKELVARAIHERSARASRPFVALNCAALSEPLLEAELFGYEPGAFTGAAPGGRDGLITAAEGGTLFLDEVGELASGLQAKLLRVLQERVFRRLGATADRTLDARVVAATNRDLELMVAEGTFREDLFYRLNVMSLAVPALRERTADVPALAQAFLAQFAHEFARPVGRFSDDALAALAAHSWPGNVRQLRNTIERAVLLAEGEVLGPKDLGLGDEPLAARLPAVEPSSSATAALRAAPAAQGLPLGDRSLRAVEEALIRRVLEECRGNRSEAARVLGINRTTLYHKLRRYEIADAQDAANLK